METTTALRSDLPEMIALLKQSLGEGLIPKSEAYFIWKHHDNPFGASKILLAKEDGKIVGLRAFMRWSWVSGLERVEAVRAVDTATDPAYQGKGIFKKLTLQAVEECTAEGTSMVFNSPNPISLQGYLKMGWYITGRMPLYIGPGSITPRLFSEGKLNKAYEIYDVQTALNQLHSDWKAAGTTTDYHTPLTLSYIKWRYQDCPILKYGAIIEPGAFGLIFRLKKVNKFMELRICEAWTEKKGADKAARKALRKLVRSLKPVLITCGPAPLFETDKKRPLGLFGPYKKGPITTLRPLANHKLNNFDNFSRWSPSIGSMELF